MRRPDALGEIQNTILQNEQIPDVGLIRRGLAMGRCAELSVSDSWGYYNGGTEVLRKALSERNLAGGRWFAMMPNVSARMPLHAEGCDEADGCTFDKDLQISATGFSQYLPDEAGQASPRRWADTEWTMDITNDGVDRYRLTTNNSMGMYRGDGVAVSEAKGYRADFDPNSIELAELLGKIPGIIEAVLAMRGDNPGPIPLEMLAEPHYPAGLYGVWTDLRGFVGRSDGAEAVPPTNTLLG